MVVSRSGGKLAGAANERIDASGRPRILSASKVFHRVF